MQKARIIGKSGKEYLFEASAIENKPVPVSRGVYVIARRIKDTRPVPAIGYYEKQYVLGIPDEESQFENNGNATIFLFHHCQTADEVSEILKDIDEDEAYEIKIEDVRE